MRKEVSEKEMEIKFRGAEELELEGVHSGFRRLGYSHQRLFKRKRDKQTVPARREEM